MYKVIVLQVLFVGQSLSYLTTNRWICRDGDDCLPVRGPHENPDEKVYENQNICRLMCGKFGGLWPQPTSTCNLAKTVVDANTNSIRFDNPDELNEDVRDYLAHNIFMFIKNLKNECGSACEAPSGNEIFIRFNINSSSLELLMETDESYNLNISSVNANRLIVQITAGTVFGARHALETFSQLIVKKTNQKTKLAGFVVISSAEIADKPIYRHRGFMLDTARHFIPMPTILRIIDGMSINKLNVFHWHITDSQSFPMESKRLPQMSEYGAFSEDKIYKQAEIESLIKYAKYRGVRVIMELDTPAHSGHGFDWGPDYGLGNLAICVNCKEWRKFCFQPNCGQLNPANPNIYPVLKDLYRDIHDFMEKHEFLHMGGDEVFKECWKSAQEITDYMKEKNYTEGFLQLWSEFQSKALSAWDEVTGNQNDSIILWSSELTSPHHIEKYLPKERYIIQTWLPDSSNIPWELMSKGYRVIMSTHNAWYFDHGFLGETKYRKWQTVYQNKLPNNPLLLGGEACMWTEYCDEHSVEVRIWPRLNAVAERLWSNPNDGIKAVESRFNRQRERLISRGIPADAITPEFCSLFEGDCR